jgi:IPT/TIG domain
MSIRIVLYDCRRRLGISGTVPGSPTTLTDGYNASDGSIVFVFTQNPPAVTGISPTSGPGTGGTTVTGTDFTGATTVTFGATPATAFSCTDTVCTTTAPAGTGTVTSRPPPPTAPPPPAAPTSTPTYPPPP